jgi:hypothetical protein
MMSRVLAKPASVALKGALLGAALLAANMALAQDAPAKHQPLQKTIGQVTPTGPVPSLMVMNAQGATLADGKLTLTGVAPNTIVFADRPVRAAGHVTTEQFLMQWDEGKDNFAIDPPNATVSVLGGEGGDVSDAVVVLTKPVLDGSTLTFDVKVLEGSLAGTGPTALFIDDRGFAARGTAVHVGPAGGVTVAHGAEVGGSNYWHAPDYHGAWYGHPYSGAAVAGAAVAGAAIGAAAANAGPAYAYPPYCGYYPYPPCY